MNTPREMTMHEALNTVDMMMLEKIVASWGFEHVSKIAELDGRIVFFHNGELKSCLAQDKYIFNQFQRIVVSWGYEGVDSRITHKAWMLSFMHNGVLCHCQAMNARTYQKSLQEARNLDLNMSNVSGKVAVALSL